MAEDFGDKTESPTAKRRRDAFNEGQFLRSREFATAITVLAGCGWLALFGPQLFTACEGLMIASFRFGAGDVDDFQPLRPLVQAGWQVLPSLGALLAIALVAAVLSQGGLGALAFNFSLIAPKASRVDPAAGLKRIFGPHGWIELGKSLLKVILLATIGYYMLWYVAARSSALVATDVRAAVLPLASLLNTTMFVMALGLVAIAMIDVPVQLIQLLRQLRMTKQEVKDEHKETEGNPESKAAIRQRRQDLAKRSKRKSVATADVVLTNPTHFSVALRYERGKDQVPVVVAKGRGEVALAIRELARDSRIPMLEYPMLTRALYFTTREGQEIRDDLYQAIATVLAFVFGLAGDRAMPPPVIAVPPSARFDENGLKLAENG